MRSFALVLLASTVSVTASCKEPSTGPFKSVLALERWHRADPADEYTMTGLVTFHRDDREPRWTDIDDHCGMHTGGWSGTEFRPPSFGKTTMQIAGREEVTFADDAEGAGWETRSGDLRWDTGDVLEVTAEGDEAPGFQVTATVPPLVSLTSHDFRALKGDQLRVRRSEPLELRWAPTEGDVLVLLLQFYPSNIRTKPAGIWCVFPASDGVAVLSPDVLGNLEPTNEELKTNIYVGGVEKQSLELEGVDLDVMTFKNEAARIRVE